ncbi:Uncharacterised protein [uncultured archaeon]|nr:Uncharacterised protein [uncultured archaeon]
MKQKLVYIIIINLILSTIAFSCLVNLSLVSAAGTAGPAGGKPPTTTTTPGTNPGIPGNAGGSSTTGTSGTSGTTTGGDTPVESGGSISGGSGNTGGGIDRGGTGGNNGNGGGTDGGGIGGDFLSFNIQTIMTKATFGSMIFGTIGSLAGGDNGALWGGLAGTIGGVVAGLTEQSLGPRGSTVLGLGVAAAIFLLTYQKKSQETVEFHCLPWQAPIGGQDCEQCNNYKECSEYTCKSLGQACDIINKGTKEQKCIWKNPHDVNSPIIEFKKVTKGHKFAPDSAIRPPDTGVNITIEKGTCIKAFTPLEFTFETDEPAQCKIDYNLTRGKEGFEQMAFYVGGSDLFSYNHSEAMSLPGPDSINAAAPELKNDGEYTLFVRCRDANGNINENSFSVSFCVEKGPDTTPPVIESVSIPTGKPVQFNQSSLYLEVYVNEPSECKWSREDRSYKNMENNMSCDKDVWEMNSNMVYTCRTNLTGIENRKENNYYFRCKDKPWAEEGDRNENKQSYSYQVIGTQPLSIISSGPKGKISGSTDYIPVFLNIQTDNGYKNGEALCYYYQGKPISDENYILFMDTSGSNHTQRQDLIPGNYTYYFKCVDLGGNAVYNTTNFLVESDKLPPAITRVFKESGELKITTNKPSECSYSTKDCNFEIDSGIKMTTYDNLAHNSEWSVNSNLYIRCKDKYNNQPNPNACSIILRPTKSDAKKDVIDFGSSENI